MYSVVGFLIGLLFGAKFNVLSLIPAHGLVLTLTVAAVIAGAESLEAATIATIASVIGLQLGYLAGVIGRRTSR